MSRGPDAATLLARALVANASRAGIPVELVAADWTRWASATFTGARHLVTLRGADGAAMRDWLAALPEAEFALRGHLVADLVVEAMRHGEGIATAMLEVLTIEES